MASLDKDFVPNSSSEIMVTFYKFCLRNKLKKLNVFSVTGLESGLNFIIGKFLEIFCFPIGFDIKTGSFEERILRSLISDSVFPVNQN